MINWFGIKWDIKAWFRKNFLGKKCCICGKYATYEQIYLCDDHFELRRIELKEQEHIRNMRR